MTWTGSVLERGVRVHVRADGRVSRVERTPSVEPGNNPPPVVRLNGYALVPGFVNAHSHAFQRGLRGRGEVYPPDCGTQTSRPGAEPSFWTWREAMYGLVSEIDTVQSFENEVRRCFREMAAAGVTTCGEFHYMHHDATGQDDFALDEAVLRAARDSNVRVVILSAYYERGGFDGRPLGPAQARFRTASIDSYFASIDRLEGALDTGIGEGVGLVAHSLRAVGVPALEALLTESNRRRIPLHLHLEEQPLEISDCVAEHGVTPMGLLLRSEAAAPGGFSRTCAVHCTHSRLDELRRFVDAGGSVCVCPLTEAALGDGIFAAPEATRGAVSLGTDCNARIDMLEEMRWLEYSQRLARGRRGAFSAAAQDPSGDLPAQLFRCATEHGAAALGVDAGMIDSGRFADFALLDLRAPVLEGVRDEHVLGAAIFGGSAEGLVVDTCVAGKWTRGDAVKAAAA